MKRAIAFAALMLACVSSTTASAQEVPSAELPQVDDPKTERARTLYTQGVQHVKRERWAEALAAFEASRVERPHATTTFNIALCERALGQYTRARATLGDAIEQGKQSPGSLAPSLETEAHGLIQEIERMLARVAVKLEPASAAIAVDGRPLHAARDGTLVAGIEPPGPGRRPPSGQFELVLNPGPHVITLTRKGYSDAVVRKRFGEGARSKLDLRIERLPATLRISANVNGALVKVADSDLGPAPVEVLRPAGTYRILVAKNGFEAYETSVSVAPGEQSDLRATLNPESRPITKEWWFWAGAAAIVVGGVVATYALTRPEPEPPDYDGGSTGWVAEPLRF